MLKKLLQKQEEEFNNLDFNAGIIAPNKSTFVIDAYISRKIKSIVRTQKLELLDAIIEEIKKMSVPVVDDSCQVNSVAPVSYNEGLEDTIEYLQEAKKELK